MRGQPGIMFYFDLRPCLKRLSAAEKGLLFDAMLDYGETGIEPELDGVLGVAWDFIRPKLDRDSERYAKNAAQKQYATFMREAKKRGHNSITFDEWQTMSDDEKDRLVSADTERYPSSNLHLTSILSSELSEVEPDEPETDGRMKKTFPPESDAYKAACCLRDEVAARLPTATPPTEKQLQGWADAFDKCNRLDGHGWAEIERVLLFSQDDPFWQKNILSGEKFRKQYTSLLARMGGG